jgi:hypothetical protein
LLVVYDSPAPARLHKDGAAIDADVFVLPRRPTSAAAPALEE